MATIYKILSPCLQECYVGSTIHKVEYRWTKHRGAKDCTSNILFEKYGMDNCKFIVMEVCLIAEKRIKEQWWLDHSVGVVNKYGVIRSQEKKKAIQKAWNEANIERVKQHRKLYREANKEKQKQYQKLYRELKKNLTTKKRI